MNNLASKAFRLALSFLLLGVSDWFLHAVCICFLVCFSVRNTTSIEPALDDKLCNPEYC